MIGLAVRVEARGFERLARQVPMAMARGLNEGGDKVRTQVRRALKVQTGVKAYRSITSRTAESGVGGNRAAPGRLAYVIRATGRGIPIVEFPVRDTGHGVDARTWGVDHVFKRSFSLKGGAAGGFRARLGKARFPIRKLYGPALPKELVKGDAAATFARSAAEMVPPAVLKHVAKAFGG